MADTIFLEGEAGDLVEVRETPYPSEDDFQRLIERHPAILAGGQIAPEDALRFVLISREMGVPETEKGGSQWYLDHLFIDQNGIPTFVEVKRSTDTRIRREVVGQMLDYAANATEYWSVADIRQLYEKGGHARTLEDDWGFDEAQVEAFWTEVGDHLRAGKVRLLFVADQIPKTLLRIIEFLNNQMVNTEILGLEIKQYFSGDGRRIVVSRAVGQTVQADDVKKPEKREWDRDSFLEDVERVGGSDARDLAARAMEDFAEMGCRIWFGKGHTHSSIVAICDGKCAKSQLVSIYPWKKGVFAEIEFCYFKAPYDTVEGRRPLKERFEAALGVAIPGKKAEGGRFSFLLSKLLDEQVYRDFMEVVRSIICGIRAVEEETLPG